MSIPGHDPLTTSLPFMALTEHATASLQSVSSTSDSCDKRSTQGQQQQHEHQQRQLQQLKLSLPIKPCLDILREVCNQPCGVKCLHMPFDT